ncbi:hypothetical protein BGAL_0432g00010 [Botrytis galanthina]|uniref:Major facilitator superfamily (MFS) profile domain-containing protein n=1 Tax=Botrytis galanthina TaxID=278940 RepID=A0A4S8QYQ7_9HELO|nr:hypothetical protein BGAL_0432g00010 [Botrytis galanthina]
MAEEKQLTTTINGTESRPMIFPLEKDKSKANDNIDDINVIDFEGEDDPLDPMNWKPWLRWSHIMLMSLMAFVLSLGDLAFAPAVPMLLSDLHVSTESPLSTLVISIYSLGTIAGNLLGPPIVRCGLCSQPTIQVLIAMRFLAGGFGAVSYTLGGPIIGDLFPAEKRGVTMAVFSGGQMIGPVVGPIFGGYLAQEQGWRWVFWLMVILSGAVYIPSVLLMRESYRPTVLQNKVRKLRKSTGNQQLKSKYEVDAKRIGLFIGAMLCGATSDCRMEKASKGGEQKPEYQLPPLLLGTITVPLGLLLYGWVAQYHLHWALPLIGTGFIGFGFMTTLLPSTNYLVDSFPLHSASAIAVTELLLAASGALFPLAAPPLYNHIGYGWGNSALAFSTIAFAPLPWLLLKFGERIRKRENATTL